MFRFALRPGTAGEIALVGGVAVAARAVFLLSFRHSPFFVSPILDSAFHHDLARTLSEGDWLAGAPYFRPPLYPWVLGGLYALIGVGPWPGRVLSAGLGVLLALAVLGTGRRLGLGPRMRLGAALAMALWPTELFFEGELLGTTLATALGAWGLWVAVGMAREREVRGSGPILPWAVLSGFWALAALSRAPLLVLPLAAAVAALAAPAGRGRKVLTVVLVSAGVWAGPAWIMAKTGEGLRFPATQGGINFYAGNHPAADGRGVRVPDLERVVGWPEFADVSLRAAAQARGHPVSAGEASRYWFSRGVAFWRDHPADAIRLWARKALYVLHGYETPNNRSLYRAREDAPLALTRSPGLYWPAGLLVPLALVGVLEVRARRRWWPVVMHAALILVPVVFFFVCSRFRSPAIPSLLLLAAAGLPALATRKKTAWGVFLLAYGLCNAPWPGAIREDPAREALARGESALGAGRLDAATRAYEQALRLDPGEGRAHLGLAVVAERRGLFAVALSSLEAAARTLGGYWALEATWARVLDRAGQTEKAARHLRAAVQDYPDHPDLWARLGLTLEALGTDREAQRALEAAALRGTRMAEGWNSLGRYRLLDGDRAGALVAWNRALDLDPDHFKARYNRGLFHATEGRDEMARRDLEAAAKVAPDSASATRARRTLGRLRGRSP